MRIRQELVLGIGGTRALAALGFEPSVYHMNEGHSAFLGLERIRQLVEAKGPEFPRRTASGGGGQRLHDAHAGAGGQRRLFARP